MENTTASWIHLRSALGTAPANATVAVSVRELDGDRVFGFQDELVLPSASTIKVLLLVALARAIDSSRLRLDDVVPLLPSQKSGGSGILHAMTTPGLELSLADHALLMITISDNSASNVLIHAIGAEGIQETQRSLALNGTNLGRRFLGRAPESGAPDNVTTAGDLVRLLSAIAAGTAASPELCEWMLQILSMQQFTDRLGRSLPANVTFAGKSGSLEGISSDSGLLRSSNGTAAVAVLTRGVRDKHEAAMFIGRMGSSVVEDLGLA